MSITYCFTVFTRIPLLPNKCSNMVRIAVYLIANENAVPFYEKLGMKRADDVMKYNHIDWTEWTVE